ncbi:TPA: glycosyltransferase [Enterococcus faecalis]|uniref:glycosyltransferase n=1 Tax=Enterococcus faecalis TaxID=1351 RepID=UPI001CB0A967|nr:glycosyltransferase [Enterococcus faecalis]HBI3767425.1 glycosyltransferase [Enterococcus faecalis]
MKYDATIVIPTYNRDFLLDLTLNSITKTKISKYSYEVIVVDDGSNDNTSEVVKHYESKLNIKYFFQENKGFRVAKARNVGIDNAEGRIIIFLDCGILFSSYAIESHIKTHDESKEDIATIGYVLGYDDFNIHQEKIENILNTECIDDCITEMLNKELFDMREPLYRELGDDLTKWPAPWCVCWTGNFSVSKKTMEECGGFDETFTTWGGEDTDMGINLYTKGVNLILSREAVGVHYPHEKEKILVSREEMQSRTKEKRKYMYNKYHLESIRIWIETNTFDLNQKILQNNAT